MTIKGLAYGVCGVIAMAAFAGAGPASAAITYDQNVTSDVIFGSGNANGGFTVDRENGIELGLRGKVRFDSTGQPQNTFNSNGAGTYTFQSGEYNNNGRPVWNFEWSINSNYDGNGNYIGNYNYVLSLDTDPGAGTTFSFPFDPIHLTTFDNAFGTNATGNGAGTVGTAGNYASLLTSTNLAQNSWAYIWYAPINPNANGIYTIQLSAYDPNNNNALVASTSINVVTTPIPAGLMLMASGLGFLGFAGRRKRADCKAETAA
jgi:hypothetical protein